MSKTKNIPEGPSVMRFLHWVFTPLTGSAGAVPEDESLRPKGPPAILQFFRYDHLASDGLKEASVLFSNVAYSMVEHVPDNPERDVALRKLLEAKDAAVRAVLYEKGSGG